MRLATWCLHIVLAGAALAFTDDLGAASPGKCRAAVETADWRRAGTICQASYDSDPRPQTALLLAKARMSTGDEDAALGLARTAERSELRGEALQVVGILLDRRGDVAAGRAALEQSLATHRAAGAHRDAARAAYALAGSYWRKAAYEETLAWLDVSATEARVANDERMLGYVAIMQADVTRRVGDDETAEREYRDAEARLAGSRADIAHVRLKVGILHMDAGRLAVGRQSLEEALSIATSTGNQTVEAAARLNLAYTAHREGDVAGGLAMLEPLASKRGVDYCYVRALLEDDRGDHAAAARLLDEAANDPSISDEWAWDVAVERGRVADELGDLDGAEAAYRRSIAVVEELRAGLDLSELQPWVLRRRRRPYEALFALLVRSGRSRDALDVLEAFTARSFLDSIARRGEPTQGGAVARAQGVFGLWRALSFPAVGGNVSARLGDREVLVHVEAAGRLWAVHRRRDGEVAILDRGSVEDVKPLVDRFVADVDDASTARVLGELLIPDEVAGGDAPLYVVPSGSLLAVPYAALRRGDRFLVDERSIALAPSLRALAGAPSAARGVGARVVADADGDLPAANEEARWVAASFGVDPLLGARATSAALRAPDSLRVLHVATHAGVDAEGAWMRLSDGRFRVQDVIESKLRADVVVLAGCASAASRHDEMWGSLAAAYLVNGSGVVIATLGSVEDVDARALVSSLYRHGVLDDPIAALGQTQRELSGRLPPKRWSAFVAYGRAAHTNGRGTSLAHP